MDSFLIDKFDAVTSIIDGTEQAKEPKLCNFINTLDAIKMLEKHCKDRMSIAVHCDVDVDGIGSGYIMYTMLQRLGVLSKTGFLINSEKEHGIKQKHCDYFANHKIGLLIVLDSASNDIEYIRKMDCDVLVIDHHDILHNETKGKTLGGEYVIVSNMMSNGDTDKLAKALRDVGSYKADEITEYEMDSAMSCGLVLYEFLRVYQEVCNTGKIVQECMLYQWAGVTLLTDSIKLSTERNQYYMDKTVHSMDVEPGLKQMLQSISQYKYFLDKTVINYSIAPRINKAIRAGASSEALNIVLNTPQKLLELDKYKARQEESIKSALKQPVYGMQHPIDKRYALIDLSGTGISKNYCGVIATKLVEKTGLNAAVCLYNPETGKYEGSFRGRRGDCNYREHFERIYPGIYAQGHPPAFGFKATGEELNVIMQSINSVEPKLGESRFYITAGNLLESEKGVHHIDDMTAFKRKQGLVRLGMANSKLSTEESISIMVKRPANLEIEWFNETQTAGTCEIMGIKCKVFEVLHTDWISVYIEYSKEMVAYARNV